MLSFFYTLGQNNTNNHFPQPDPDLSLGGAWSVTQLPLSAIHSLFGAIRPEHVGVNDYRAFIIQNQSSGSQITIRIRLTNPNTPSSQFWLAYDPELFQTQDDPRQGLWHLATTPAGRAALDSSLTWLTPTINTPPITLLPRYGVMVWIRTKVDYVPDIFQTRCDVVITENTSGSTLNIINIIRENGQFYALTEPYRIPLYETDVDLFDRVEVDYSVEGYARVSWRIRCPLTDPYPYLFQLQFTRQGIPNADDWENVGPPVIPEQPFLIDPVKRLHGMGQNIFYRIKLITGNGNIYYSKPVHAFGNIKLEKLFVYRELLRKEMLAIRRFGGIEGVLLKVKRYGPMCPTCVDPTLREVADSHCPTCYGTGIQGGYCPPVFGVNADTSFESTIEHVEHENLTGMQDEAAVIPARFAAIYPIQTRDVWINVAADKRYYVAQVKTLASYQGLPVSYAAELRLANRKDVIYKFPIYSPLQYQLPPWQQYCVIPVS